MSIVLDIAQAISPYVPRFYPPQKQISTSERKWNTLSAAVIALVLMATPMAGQIQSKQLTTHAPLLALFPWGSVAAIALPVSIFVQITLPMFATKWKLPLSNKEPSKMTAEERHLHQLYYSTFLYVCGVFITGCLTMLSISIGFIPISPCQLLFWPLGTWVSTTVVIIQSGVCALLLLLLDAYVRTCGLLTSGLQLFVALQTCSQVLWRVFGISKYVTLTNWRMEGSLLHTFRIVSQFNISTSSGSPNASNPTVSQLYNQTSADLSVPMSLSFPIMELFGILCMLLLFGILLYSQYCQISVKLYIRNQRKFKDFKIRPFEYSIPFPVVATTSLMLYIPDCLAFWVYGGYSNLCDSSSQTLLAQSSCYIAQIISIFGNYSSSAAHPPQGWLVTRILYIVFICCVVPYLYTAKVNPSIQPASVLKELRSKGVEVQGRRDDSTALDDTIASPIRASLYGGCILLIVGEIFCEIFSAPVNLPELLLLTRFLIGNARLWVFLWYRKV